LYLAAVLAPPRLPRPGAPLELASQHRIPLAWLLQHGGESIRYRTLRELAPDGYAPPGALAEAEAALQVSKPALAVIKKQKDTGTWGGNLLGLAPSAAQGIKDIGTIAQYRRLLELAWPREGRPFKLAERLLFRLLTRDENPALLFEFQKLVGTDAGAEEWIRGLIREAATAALAEAGHQDDPRIRGAGHRIATAISHFLRSPVSEKPFTKSGASIVLHGEAHPPSWYSVAMVAAMPSLQRERAGFTERLGHYLAQPAPKKAFSVQLGRKLLKPTHLLLGDPIEADGKGNPADLPLALHYIELLARLRALHTAPVATKVLARLVRDCDDQGVWAPKGLRSQPKALNPISHHYYPLLPEPKTAEGRVADVTFRLALIAKTLGWQLDYV
jgi:hypothetical protein